MRSVLDRSDREDDDYINRVVLTLPLSVYEGTWTHSPLSLLCITMILRVCRNFFEISMLPNTMLCRIVSRTADSMQARLYSICGALQCSK